jgi:hypothetical protein
VQDHQNGMSSSWRGTRLKTTQIVTRRRDNLAPRKNARHQIRAVVWRLLQIDWAAHPETKRISDWKRSGVSLPSFGKATENGVRSAVTPQPLRLYVGRILRVEKSSDLPIQQEAKFEQVINLKTAEGVTTLRQERSLREDSFCERAPSQVGTRAAIISGWTQLNAPQTLGS